MTLPRPSSPSLSSISSISDYEHVEYADAYSASDASSVHYSENDVDHPPADRDIDTQDLNVYLPLGTSPLRDALDLSSSAWKPDDSDAHNMTLVAETDNRFDIASLHTDDVQHQQPPEEQSEVDDDDPMPRQSFAFPDPSTWSESSVASIDDSDVDPGSDDEDEVQDSTASHQGAELSDVPESNEFTKPLSVPEASPPPPYTLRIIMCGTNPPSHVCNRVIESIIQILVRTVDPSLSKTVKSQIKVGENSIHDIRWRQSFTTAMSICVTNMLKESDPPLSQDDTSPTLAVLFLAPERSLYPLTKSSIEHLTLTEGAAFLPLLLPSAQAGKQVTSNWREDIASNTEDEWAQSLEILRELGLGDSNADAKHEGVLNPATRVILKDHGNVIGVGAIEDISGELLIVRKLRETGVWTFGSPNDDLQPARDDERLSSPIVTTHAVITHPVLVPHSDTQDSATDSNSEIAKVDDSAGQDHKAATDEKEHDDAVKVDHDRIDKSIDLDPCVWVVEDKSKSEINAWNRLFAARVSPFWTVLISTFIGICVAYVVYLIVQATNTRLPDAIIRLPTPSRPTPTPIPQPKYTLTIGPAPERLLLDAPPATDGSFDTALPDNNAVGQPIISSLMKYMPFSQHLWESETNSGTELVDAIDALIDKLGLAKTRDALAVRHGRAKRNSRKIKELLKRSIISALADDE